MKHKYLTPLLAVLMSMTANVASAYDAVIDGIYYDLSGTKATVTYYSRNTSNSNAYSGDVVIPEAVTYEDNTYNVTKIGSYAFVNCSEMTSVTIPNGVTSIGNRAFSGCSAIERLTIPSSVTTFDFYLNSCSSLKTLQAQASLLRTAFENSMYNMYNNFRSLYSFTDLYVDSPSIESWCTEGFLHNGVLYEDMPKIHMMVNGTEMTEVVIPDGVTEIVDEAFHSLSEITRVVIPSSVTSIGHLAFRCCSSLREVVLPGSVSLLSDGCFSRTGLEQVVVPEGVKALDQYAFDNCPNLTSVSLPSTLTSIGKCAFESCTALTSITIPENVASIGYNVFNGCTALSSITINCPTIPSGCFSGLSSLQEITLADKVTSIGYDAFKGTAWYDNLPDGLIYAGKVAYTYKGTMPEGTEIILKDGTLGIAGQAFYGCTGLTSITIPESVIDIGENAFNRCTGLISVTINCPTIPASCFNGLTSLQEITIGDKVTSIGYYAFNGTAWYDNQPDGLIYAGKVAYKYKGDMPEGTEIVLKDGTLGIAGDAFFGCVGLTSVTIPESVITIGDYAFYACMGLTSVIIPERVINIGKQAFRYCIGLTSVTIPGSVASIGQGAFIECSGLENIVVENGNTVYDSRDNCNAIIETASNTLKAGCKNTTIPGSVTSIGADAFIYCAGLTSITIPGSVVSIGLEAFYGCRDLTSITIPQSVTSIGMMAFNSCSGLEYIVVENGNTVYDSRDNCNAIIETASNTLITGCKNTVIPSSVISIGDYAFLYCTSLNSITIPEGVSSIGTCAFSGCTGLTSVIIPESVKDIYSQAFQGCNSLTSVTVAWEKPLELWYNPFPNATNATLYVPKGTKEAYEAAQYWKDFKEIIEVEDTEVASLQNSKAIIKEVYDLNGRQQPKLQRGINIMRMSDGTTKKVLR